MTVKHNLVEFGDQQNLTVVLDGEMYVADNNHPNWTAILNAVNSDQVDGLADLFDTQKALDKKFKKVSERVSVKNGLVTFDGDVVDNSLTKQILRFMEEGVDDWKPLVAFMEKVQTNPKKNSRRQLYDFLENNAFTITDDGDILGYKGFYTVNAEEGIYQSSHSGTATVNGVEQKNQRIVQKVGDVVEMPRSAVTYDPSQGCSYGLHISNYEYASGYGNVVMEVLLNPRDVVSVPKEHSWQKVRACRYTNLGLADGNNESALYVSKHAAPVVEDLAPEDTPAREAEPESPAKVDAPAFANIFDAFLGIFAPVNSDAASEAAEDDVEDELDSWDDDGGYFYSDPDAESWEY